MARRTKGKREPRTRWERFTCANPFCQRVTPLCWCCAVTIGGVRVDGFCHRCWQKRNRSGEDRDGEGLFKVTGTRIP